MARRLTARSDGVSKVSLFMKLSISQNGPLRPDRRSVSPCVEIVESCAGKQDPLATEGDFLGFEQAPLTGSLRERAVCANDTVPWRLARIGVAQHVARQTGRAG